MKKIMNVEISAENNGRWTYTTIELPAKEYEIQDAFQRAKIYDENGFYEFVVNYCEILPHLERGRLDSPSIYELNFLAQRLGSLDEQELVALKAVFPKYVKTGEGEIVSIKDVINVTYGLDKALVISNISNATELGKFVVAEEVNPIVSATPEEVLPYLDLKKIGELQQKIDDGVFADGHYVLTGSYEFKEVYDGKQQLPTEEEYSHYVFRLEVAKPPQGDAEVDATDTRWLHLPLDRVDADEIAKQLGVSQIEDCVYLSFESTIPQIASDHFGDMEDFNQLNELAKLVEGLSYTDQAKFKAVLEANRLANLEDFLDVASNVNRYEFAPDIEDGEQYFMCYIAHHLPIDFDNEIFNQIEVGNCRTLEKLTGATVTNYGLISAQDKPLFEVLPVDAQQSSVCNEPLDLIEINGKYALFSNSRIDVNVAQWLYRYDLRGSDYDGTFVSIERKVLVNHAGTILTKEPFNLGESGYIPLNDETSPNFLGDEMTIRQFQDTDLDSYLQEQKLTEQC